MAHILLVEDNSEISQMLCNFLKRENFEVTIKNNGAAAIEAFERGDKHYDLVLTDLLMPEGDGFDLLLYMKDNSLDIPSIVISGGGITLDPHETLKAVADLATLSIPKPLDLDELLAAIKKILGVD